MKELRKCEICGKYMFSVSQKLDSSADASDWKERMRYCVDCWINKVNKTKSLKEIENENQELPESEKQRLNTMEEYNDDHDPYRRYRAN